jgi:hypothetical protein
VPQCFDKQLRRVENAFANRRRAVAPCGIELPGFAGVGAKFDESRRHALAIVETDARDGDQILHGEVRREFAFAHLLLDGFGQKFDQREAARDPAGAFIEASRQCFQIVVEASFQFRQQPALFESGFMFGETKRAVEDQGVGFAHRPDHGVHRVAAQLAQRGEAFVAVDDEEAFAVGYYDDRRLLAGFGERGKEATMAFRVVHTEMLTGPVELVKFQLHGRGRRWGPVCGPAGTDLSGLEGEVGWEAL